MGMNTGVNRGVKKPKHGCKQEPWVCTCGFRLETNNISTTSLFHWLVTAKKSSQLAQTFDYTLNRTMDWTRKYHIEAPWTFKDIYKHCWIFGDIGNFMGPVVNFWWPWAIFLGPQENFVDLCGWFVYLVDRVPKLCSFVCEIFLQAN